MNEFRDGDVLVTYGDGGFWPPRRWLLWVVYKGIRAFQRAKWGRGSDAGPTHVRMWIRGRFFEMTTPVGRWTALNGLALPKKNWKVARIRDAVMDLDAMEARAESMIGKKYDIGDLLDFALTGLVGRFVKRIRIFGDRVEKYTVCSTSVANVFKSGGVPFLLSRDDLRPGAGIEKGLPSDVQTMTLETRTIDPAYFVNNPSHWEIVAAHVR